MKIELFWVDVERMERKMSYLYGKPHISLNDTGYVVSFANSNQIIWEELQPWGGIRYEDELKKEVKGTLVLTKKQ